MFCKTPCLFWAAGTADQYPTAITQGTGDRGTAAPFLAGAKIVIFSEIPTWARAFTQPSIPAAVAPG